MKIHKVVDKYFQRKKKSQPGFSLRSLAKQLKISPSFLSRVMSGKKPLPFPLLQKLKSSLDIEDEVYTSLKESFFKNVVVEKSVRNSETNMPLIGWDLVDKKGFTILRQWFFLPILEVTTLSNFDGSVVSIAKRLGLSETTTAIAVRELISLGLMQEKNGVFSKTNKKFRWASGKSLKEIRLFHYQMMTKAQEELSYKYTEEDFEKRLITGITLTASPEKISAAKKKLSDALHEIANDLVDDNGTEVYQLSAQLFPLTK